MAVGAGTWVGKDCDQTGKVRYSPDGKLFNNGLNYQLGAEGQLRTAYSFTGPPTQFKTGRFAFISSSAAVRIDWDDGNGNLGISPRLTLEYKDWTYGAPALFLVIRRGSPLVATRLLRFGLHPRTPSAIPLIRDMGFAQRRRGSSMQRCAAIILRCQHQCQHQHQGALHLHPRPHS